MKTIREELIYWTAFCRGMCSVEHKDWERARDMDEAVENAHTPADCVAFYIRFRVWHPVTSTPRARWAFLRHEAYREECDRAAGGSGGWMSRLVRSLCEDFTFADDVRRWLKTNPQPLPLP